MDDVGAHDAFARQHVDGNFADSRTIGIVEQHHSRPRSLSYLDFRRRVKAAETATPGQDRPPDSVGKLMLVSPRCTTSTKRTASAGRSRATENHGCAVDGAVAACAAYAEISARRWPLPRRSHPPVVVAVP